MRYHYLLLTAFICLLSFPVFGQCPPPGFPEPGNTCPEAPILCPDLDGYCSTINNNNVSRPYPCCQGWTLNNDEWFGFFAGTTSITIEIVPENCSSGGQQGLQGAIYDNCPPANPSANWCDNNLMDAQCSCTEDPFTLSSSDFVIGEVYWIVLDGCAGNVCDYTVNVLEGSTVGFPPDDPGDITGPSPVCQGTSTDYSVGAVNGATIYTWSITPSSAGSLNMDDNEVTVTWSNSFSGTAQICLKVANLCFENPDTVCYTVEVLPRPTATISGSGVICNGSGGSVNLTVNLTGDAPWEFVYSVGGQQTTVTTSTSPYTITATQPGTYTLVSVESTNTDPDCPGTVSGSATVTEVTINPSSTTVAANCGQATGSINLSHTGGNAPFTYSWSNGATVQDPASLEPGTYTVTITDNNGCTRTHSVTVSDNITNPSLTANVTNNTTCNGGNGAIDLSATPAGNYTYNWSNGATTQDINNLTPGTYTVTVTLGVTCSATGSYTVADNPNLPNPTATAVNTTCDFANGSINASVTGGVAPYTYAWSNGATTEDLSNIPAGSYTLTVTGANGCTNTVSVNITNNNPAINITANVQANTTCNGGNGSIDVSVAPAGSYTYTWSNGATSQDISNLPPGGYTVTVSAGGTCTAEATFNVPDQPNLPTPSAVPTQSTCDLANGSINGGATGGVPPYTFLWSNGATTEDLSNILAGNYVLTVTGANGCTNTVSVDVGNNNPPFNATANILPNTVCNAAPNGSIDVSMSPANPNYTYTWSTGETTQDLTGLSPGSYTLTVSAGGSCTNVFNFEVPGNPNQPSITPTITNTSCDFSNGSISLSVTGGTLPYTFLWSNGATTQNLVGVPSGSYSVTVTSPNGCTSEATINVDNVNPLITPTAVVMPNTTCNAFPNGSINMSVAPPNPSYTYNWSTGATTQDLNNLPPGSYTVTISAGGSCTQIATFDVPDVPNAPNLNATFISANCGLANGSINLTPSGGITPYTYSWSNGSSTQDISNIPGGSYDVTVTGANGCSSILNVDVPNLDIPVDINAFVNPQTSCITNNGSINLVISPLNASIVWSNGATTANITGLAVGEYTVTVSAGGTCTASATYNIDDNREYPILTAEITPVVCGLVNGAVNLEVEAGIPPYTYDWAHIPGPNNLQDLNNVSANNYAVTVTTAAGCTEVLYAEVPAEALQIEITGYPVDDVACTYNNGSIELDVQPMVTYQYNWAHIPGGNNPEDLNNLGAGSYTVTVVYGTCNASATFEIFDMATSPSASVSASAATCGQSNGSAIVSASGAIPPYTYDWSNVPGNNNPPSINNVAPGVYTVTVTDFFDCSATASVTVGNSTIAINISGNPAPNTSCASPNGTLSLNVTPSGNNYVYNWSNSATTQNLSGIAPGIYSVTVSAGVGCSAEATFIVGNATVNPQLNANVVAAICSQPNGNIDLNAGGGAAPYNFAWSNAATTEDLTAILPGNYSVTVTDANGCTADTTLNVANNASTFSLSGTAVPHSDCATINGAIDLLVTPAGPYTYLWSTGATTQDLANLPAGTYTVEVTEQGTCVASATYFVIDTRTYPVLNQSIIAELCNLADGAIDLSVLGGLAPFTYNWDSGQTTEDLGGIGGGTYLVTVSGANNCTASATMVVPENDIPFALAGVANPNTSCVVLNGSVDLSVSPPVPSAGPGYTYSWSIGQQVEDLSAVPAGSYVVTVSAGGTCTNTAVFVVNDGAGAPSLSENIVEALCGQSSGSVNITVSGGFTPYTYLWSNGILTEDLSDMPSGNYAVTVTGDNGCSVIGAYTVPEGVVTPQLSGIPAPNTACVGPNGSINLAISPANLTYLIQWSNGSSLQDLSNLTPGTYTVTVNGGGACTASASYVVGNNTNLVSAAGTDIDILCFGDNTGSINLTLSGGTQPFDFNWSAAGIGNIEDPGSLVAGLYAVTVTDAVGCSATASFNITQPGSSPQVSCAALNTVSQPGFADGSAQAIISGGVAPYEMLLSPGGNQTGIAAGTLPINGLTVGAYTVQVTDANGCIANCGFNIALATCETALGQMGASQEALCGQGCITANYDALGQFLDPDDLLQFVLHQGAGATIVGELGRSNTPTFCFNPAQMTYGTVYYVSAVAGNNDGTGNVNLDHYCTIITTGTPIVFYEKPVASIAPPAEITCAVTQVTLVGSSNMPNSIYLWSSFNGNIIGATDQPDIQTNQAGTYALQVSANGCLDTTYSDVLDIRNDPVAEILASPDDILDCVIDQIILAGEIKGSGNANAIWFDQNGATYPGGTVLQIDQPGTYWFAIVDTLTFCSDTASIIIGEDQIYPPLFVNPPALLTCTNGAVTLSGGSPIGGISFTWAVLVGQDTVVIGTGASTSVSQPGEYLLLGIDPANGCDNAMAVTVVADQSFPTAEAGPPFNLDCYGQTANLNGSATGGTGQLTYVWTTSGGVILSGANTPSPLISEPGTYTLLVTALGNGCSDTDVVVVAPNEPRATLRVEDPNCFGEKGRITVDSVAGAKPPVEFTLTGGQHSQSGNTFFGLAPGAYTVLIEDADGCATEVEATIVQPPPFEVTVEPQVSLQLGESYVVDATVNVPESEIALIEWTPATWLSCDTCLSTRIDTPLYSQQYELLVVTKAGCRDEAPLLLRVNRQVNVYIPNIFSPNGDGDNDFFTVFADLKGVRKVNSLQIYSRWGEQVFQRHDFQPNQLELGWDGRFRGQEMNPAVFVYYAIVEFIDGQEVLFKGDVTLER